MKNNITLIALFLLIAIILKPLHVHCIYPETYKSYTTLHQIEDDPAKNKQQSQKDNDEQPNEDANDDNIEYNDNETDEDLEDIPDDFYDYQEENL